MVRFFGLCVLARIARSADGCRKGSPGGWDRPTKGRALNGLGSVFYELRRFDEAIDHLQQALAIGREVGDRLAEGITLSILGRVSRELRRFDEAIDHLQEALAIHQEVGDRRAEGITLYDLGLVYYKLRRFDEAIDHLQEALAIHQEVGDRRAEGITLSSLGRLYGERAGSTGQATTSRRPWRSIRRSATAAPRACRCTTFGLVYREQDRYDRASDHYQQALAIYQEVGDRRAEGLSLGTEPGHVLREQGQHDRALVHLQQTLAIDREIGDRHSEGLTLYNLGALYHELRGLCRRGDRPPPAGAGDPSGGR